MYFDIGSNIGKWTLENIDRCDKIISVEASPSVFERLKQNCNNDKITLVNYAVCDNNFKDITFFQADCDTISTINKDWLTCEKMRFCNFPYKEIVCKTTTIDELIRLFGIPELIKIDVEGGEYDCIKSLTQKVDLLCFEWASETNDITFKSLDYLTTLGFSRFFLQFEDKYTFRPTEFYDLETIKNSLSKTIPRNEWGMVWCK